MRVKLLGDIHGRVEVAKDAIGDIPVIQVGDFGLKHAWYQTLHMTKKQLMVVGGNHDDYDYYEISPVALGDFGLIPGCKNTFYIRGGVSIDRAMRIEGESWWPQEELNYSRTNDMLDIYEKLKPEVVISHEGPLSATYSMFGRFMSNWTAKALQEALKIHRPKRWYFGHHHISMSKQLSETEFRCLGIDELLEVDLP